VRFRAKFWWGLLLAVNVLCGIIDSQASSVCATGVYRSPDGNFAAITPVAETAPAGTWYTMLDGRSGYASEKSSPVACIDGSLRGKPAGGQWETWTKLEFRFTTLSFPSGDAVLYGLLMEPELPPGGSKPPLMILAHGSGKQSPIEGYYQYLLGARGIATFFYDKRGTGKSTGEYTQDFYVLADDAANAVKVVRQAAAGRYSRIGFLGTSQGGWVAPLAAAKAKVDFVEVAYGVVGTPVEQDEWQVEYQMREAGYLGFSDEIDTAVQKITQLTGAIATSNFSKNVEELDSVRKKYSGQSWFSAIDGQYSGELLRGEIAKAKAESPGVPWNYPALSVLRQLRIPQLWVFASDDSVAPAPKSVERLEHLRATLANSEHFPIEIVVFPHSDHDIHTFTQDEHGRRTPVGLADGFLRLLGDWANGTVHETYGDAFWVGPHQAPAELSPSK